MLIYVSRRLLWTPVLLFFAGLFIFSLSSITPGDPAELMAGQRADPEAIERIRDRLGLNDPFMVQYLRYISNALKGDLGESYRYRGRDVVELLAPRLKVSLELNIVSYFVTLIIGLPLGFGQLCVKERGRTRLLPRSCCWSMRCQCSSRRRS